MAERPSDDWFRSTGWTEFATCWVKDYDSLTFRASKGMQRVYTDANGGGWYREAVNADDPVALHNAWFEEEKRRATPLDPARWQHFPGCSIHLAGGYRIHQWDNGEFGVYKMPHKLTNATGFMALEHAIAACNEHARENGVKSC